MPRESGAFTPSDKSEKVLLQASNCHFVLSVQAQVGRLCRAYLTEKRLALCEAFVDIRNGCEKEGPSQVLHEVPLNRIKDVRADLAAAEPSLRFEVAGQPEGSEKLALHFRDPEWHLGDPSRAPELYDWLRVVNAELSKLGTRLRTTQSAAPLSGAPPPSTTRRPSEAAAPSVATRVLKEGTILAGKYELGRRIGEGGMGLVFMGQDRSLERPVAIKQMRPEVKMKARDRDAFLREARTSASLHHPFIADIYEIVQDGEGGICLVFEFVDGETIADVLDRRARMKPKEALWALRDVCEALAFAHSRKVAHRDLKPSNIMLTRQGHAKVMDFGIARAMKDTLSRLSNLDTSGTMPYMAPEQELGRFGARSDLYALGVTAYEMLTGELPFAGPKYFMQKEAMRWTPLSEAAPDAPRELAEAVERCLRFDPKERFETVAEFARAIGALERS